MASGWTLLKQPDETERNDAMATVDTAEPLRRAFYPLTLPLTVGPGSISVAITLGANAAGRKGHWCPDHVERDQPAAVLSSGLRPLGRQLGCLQVSPSRNAAVAYEFDHMACAAGCQECGRGLIHVIEASKIRWMDAPSTVSYSVSDCRADSPSTSAREKLATTP